MLVDSRNEFASAVALSTVGTGLAAIGDVIDTEVARNIGQGQPLFLVIFVTTAVTSAGAATVVFQLVSDTANPPAADATETLHVESAAIPVATLVAGFRVILPVPPQAGTPYERYLGVQQNVGVAALTAGAVDAFLTTEPYDHTAYPDAQN
jgi:hypothetical protein